MQFYNLVVNGIFLYYSFRIDVKNVSFDYKVSFTYKVSFDYVWSAYKLDLWCQEDWILAGMILHLCEYHHCLQLDFFRNF